MNEFEFKGLLKPEEEKDCGKSLDTFIDFTKIFPKKKLLSIAIEAFDGKLFTAFIREFDDRLADRIPEEYKPEARAVLLAIIAKDWEDVAATSPQLLNALVDIPGIEEETELVIIAAIVQGIYAAAIAYAQKRINS